MIKLASPSARKLRRSALIALGRFGVITAGLFLHVNSSAPSVPPVAAKPALTVSATSPKLVEWPVILLAKGSILPWQEASVSTEASSLRIAELRADIGDRVHRGQVLARLEADTMAAELAQTRANLAEARAAAKEAQVDADRARQMIGAGGAMSMQQINQYLTAEQTTMARVDALQARERIDEKRLAQTQIVAPDDGTISARVATLGAVVQAGQELFRMIRRDRLEWRAQLPAEELARVKPGMRATLSSGPHRYSGKVRLVSPDIDVQTRNGLVYVELDAAANARAGTFTQGEIVLERQKTLVLPQAAVLQQDGLHYVFRIDARNRVVQTRIEVGERIGEQIAVSGSIDASTQVVSSAVGFLADGDLVRLAPTTRTQ